MYVDPRNHTTATLCGNDAAMQAVHPREAAGAPAYPAGAVLALVTWARRDNPHWFGGRVPDIPLSVEFVQAASAGQTNIYRRFAGSGLVENPSPKMAAQRTNFMLGLAPARLP